MLFTYKFVVVAVLFPAAGIIADYELLALPIFLHVNICLRLVQRTKKIVHWPMILWQDKKVGLLACQVNPIGAAVENIRQSC